MKLRPLEPADFPTVVALYNATSADEVEGGAMEERAFHVDYWEPPPPWRGASLALEWESTLAGALMARFTPGEKALRVMRLIALDEDAGVALAKAAVEKARELGLALVEGSAPSLVERVAFEAAGFRVTEEILEMRRPLADAPAPPREATPLTEADDAEAARCVTAAFAGEERPVTDARQIAMLRGEGVTLGVRDGARVLAFAAVKPSGGEPDVAEIHLVGVDPAARGRGLGKIILAAALAAGRSMGLREAWLATGSDNAGAVKLYESMGFTVTKRNPWMERAV